MADGSAVEIGLVLYPGVQRAAVLGMTDLFAVAERLARAQDEGASPPRLRLSHWAGEAAPRRVFDTGPESEAPPAVLVLPPGLGPPLEAGEARAFTPWLRRRHGAGTVLASICKGAFLLGETGLLNGRAATTHWSYEAAFAERFPAVRLDTARLIVDEGDIVTAGGVMAWTDLALVLVDQFLGPVAMMETAQTFLIDPPGREQSYYGRFAPRLTHGDGAILAVQHWMQESGARRIDLASLVARSGLEERSFLRRFRAATGLTSTDYGQRLRVGRARELLQEGRLSVDQVAYEVGYADVGAFRKVFARIVGLSPADYRRRFRARALSAPPPSPRRTQVPLGKAAP